MDYNNELYHYGVKGMKWGVRRYMNVDGSLTPAGQKRYAGDEVGQAKLAYKSAKKEYNKAFNKASNYSSAHPIGQWTNKKKKAESDRRWDDAIDKADKLNKAKSDYKQIKKESKAAKKQTEQTEKKGLSDNQKKAIKVGAAAAGTALAAYGAYKLSKVAKEKAYEKNIDRGYTAIAKLMADRNSNHIRTSMGFYNKNDEFIQDKLYESVNRYAKRHSNTTTSAVKTLLGKNREFTIPELINQGVGIVSPELWR